jgi:transcriptional regulator with XRE-family HTH domain
MIDKSENLGDEITLRDLRERAGYTQEQLARNMNVSKSLIGYYEARKKIPKADNFLLLAKHLKVSVKTLAKSLGLDASGIPDEDLPQISSDL